MHGITLIVLLESRWRGWCFILPAMLPAGDGSKVYLIEGLFRLDFLFFFSTNDDLNGTKEQHERLKKINKRTIGLDSRNNQLFAAERPQHFHCTSVAIL